MTKMTKRPRMSEADKHAKHVEIARRYAWHARRQGAKYPALRAAELVRVFRGRLGGEMSRAELDRHIIAAAGDDRASCGASTLGQRIHLTLEERMRYDVRTMQASDKTKREIREAYAKRKRERDRDYRRRDRVRKAENAKMNHDLSVRQEALWNLLHQDGKWMTVRQVAKAVRDYEAWQRPDRSRLTIASLRTLVHRELNNLARQGKIKESRKINRYGIAERYIQAVENPKKLHEATDIVSVNTVTEGVATRRGERSADEISTSCDNKNVSPYGNIESPHPSYDATTRTNGEASSASGCPTKPSPSLTTHQPVHIVERYRPRYQRIDTCGRRVLTIRS
jgi:hypothetical protein